MKSTGLADSPLFVKPKEKKKNQPRPQYITVSNNQDTLISFISKSIREIGKEASTYRLTLEEKKTLIEIIYKFKIKNISISENMIVRIALYILLNDHKMKGEKSLLTRVLTNLNQNR